MTNRAPGISIMSCAFEAGTQTTIQHETKIFMSLMTIFLIAWIAASIIMFAMWLLQYRTSNAGIVDVTWAFFTPLVGLWLVLADDVENNLRQYLIAALALTWGIRLGLYLHKRVSNETEDGRYRYMTGWAYFPQYSCASDSKIGKGGSRQCCISFKMGLKR